MIYFIKGEATRLQPNFTSREFDCKGTTCNCRNTWIDPQLTAFLQQIRNHYGLPLYITSGYRCQEHNTTIGGTENSRHTRGEAADFYIKGIPTTEISAYCESIGILGIGCYDSNHGNFVHIDTRAQKYFWKNRSENAVPTFGGTTPEEFQMQVAKLYAVSCRNDDGTTLTALFDPAVGEYCQSYVTMKPRADGAAFSAGSDTQILQITAL